LPKVPGKTLIKIVVFKTFYILEGSVATSDTLEVRWDL